MNKQFTFLSVLLSVLMLPLIAHAEIYKLVDSEGRVTYSNVKIKGAKKLQLEPADTNFGTDSGGEKKSAPSTRTSSPASFPKVDAGTQNQRDSKRKEILQSELDSEKKALEDAKKAYTEGESNPEVYKTKDGKTMRNVPKYEEKMKTLQDAVDAHQRNIDLLTKEINAIN
jgi:hypothetical protein